MNMMKKILLTSISVIMVATIVSGQTGVTTAQAVHANGVYTVPFGTSGNTLELIVVNTSAQSATGVKVEGVNTPPWVHFTPEMQTIQAIDAKAEKEVTFAFSVDKTAPVKKDQTFTFKITSSTGEQWTKQINIAIAAPDKFELFQNYPNPFNPSTKIEYQLPSDGIVSLRIYNMLGQEVSTLVNEQQESGYKSVEWNASQVSSGIYFYRLQCGSYSSMKKMMMVK
jgi:hypothetical protein